jgi:maleylacetate reductase
MEPFVHTSHPSRVVFGVGSITKVADEVRALGISRVFLIADGAAAAFADQISWDLGPLMGDRWNEVVQHVPVELAERARAAFDASGADGVVCVGGGSSTGLAKAIALTHSFPILAVPTTYAGSEMTTIYGLTGGAHKQTGKNPIVLPRTVIYDAALTVGLPGSVTGPSAFNAIAHDVEALYGPGNNPVVTTLALESIRAISRSLKAAIDDPNDLDARSDVLYGAHLAGVALGATGTALHHKACHVLGGMFNLVHGDMNSVVLPHAVSYNYPHVIALMNRVRDALGVTPDISAATALFDLAHSIGAPTALSQIGMKVEDIEAAVPNVVADVNGAVGANPCVVDEAGVRKMLTDAFHGKRPI